MLQNGAIVIYHSAPAKIVSFSNGKIALKVRPGDSKNVREKDIDFVLHSGPAQLPLAEVPVPDLRENLELHIPSAVSKMFTVCLPLNDILKSRFLLKLQLQRCLLKINQRMCI